MGVFDNLKEWFSAKDAAAYVSDKTGTRISQPTEMALSLASAKMNWPVELMTLEICQSLIQKFQLPMASIAIETGI